ncbi:unnamed protein product [Prunus armeniaca]
MTASIFYGVILSVSDVRILSRWHITFEDIPAIVLIPWSVFHNVVLVHENRGVPDGLFIIHLPFGPTAFFELLYVVTRHDIKDKKAMGTMPQVYPHLILDNFTTKLGERIAKILKHLSCAKARYKTHNHFFQLVGLYFIQASYLWEA